MDAHSHIGEVNGMENQTTRLEVPQDLLFRQNGTVRTYEHVVLRIEFAQGIEILRLQSSVKNLSISV